MNLPFTLASAPPYLTVTFPAPQTMLSWSITHPGFTPASRVVWLEVRNKDLPPEIDALAFLTDKLKSAGFTDSPALITSRDISQHHLAQTSVDGVTATCLATVGLSNGERVGQRSTEPVPTPGTVNMLVHLSCAMTDAAFLEALSIAAEARTAAILDAGIKRDGIAITGTGTDCIVLAAPQSGEATAYAGLHTAAGETIGKSVYDAMRAGIDVWEKDFAALMRKG